MKELCHQDGISIGIWQYCYLLQSTYSRALLIQHPALSMYQFSVTRVFTASHPNRWKKAINSSNRQHIFESVPNVPHPHSTPASSPGSNQYWNFRIAIHHHRVHVAPREYQKGLFCLRTAGTQSTDHLRTRSVSFTAM